MEAPSFSVDHLGGNRVKGATLILDDRAMYLQDAKSATGLHGRTSLATAKCRQIGGEGQYSVKVETVK
jgi:hypothetical protein